jgi:DNA-binding NtrC family response regulator
MPNMTGIQLLEELKRIRPDIPIILSTGFGESITAARVKDLGFHSMLMKPIDRTNLARTIGDALGKEKLRS